jgi:hypothetical protein
MTALDFVAAGIRFVQERGLLVAHAPVGHSELVEQLRAAVAERLALVRGDIPRRVAGDGICACGDVTEDRECELCVLARQKLALEAAPAPGPAKKRRQRAPALRVSTDPWADVESECPGELGRAAHAGRIHLHGSEVACVAWRPLQHGERATDAWIAASSHRVRVDVQESYSIGGDHRQCPCTAKDAEPGPCSWCNGTVHAIIRHTWRLEVPGAREAQYPAPTMMAFQMPEGVALDAQHTANSAAWRAYFERVLRPAVRPIGAAPHAPARRRMRIPGVAA